MYSMDAAVVVNSRNRATLRHRVASPSSQGFGVRLELVMFESCG